jgi:hypothetical protein
MSWRRARRLRRYFVSNDPIRLAQVVFALDAVLGILAIGGAALFGAAYSSGSVWTSFLSVFVPLSALWTLFCYLAYKGLTSDNLVLKAVFWLNVVGNAIGFPVGTAIAGASIWLWRELRRAEPSHPTSEVL